MKFAFFSHVWNRNNIAPAERYEEALYLLEHADALGFEYSFCLEHHFTPHESLIPSPTAFLAAASQRTKAIRLGSMGYILPIHNPVRLCEEIAMLDHLLKGRLELGVVSGYRPSMLEPFGVNFRDRGQIFYRNLDKMLQAWSSGSVSYKGGDGQEREVTLSVKPLQRPHPPLWVMSRSPRSLRALAESGIHTGYIMLIPRAEVAPLFREYRRIWKDKGHSHQANIAYWILTYVDKSDDRAQSVAKRHIIHSLADALGTEIINGKPVFNAAENFKRMGEDGAAEIARHLGEFDYLLDNDLILVGSPSTVKDGILRIAKDGQVNCIFAEFDMGLLDRQNVLQSMKLFSEQVVPEVRNYEPTP